MPTVTVSRQKLFAAIGREFSACLHAEMHQIAIDLDSLRSPLSFIDKLKSAMCVSIGPVARSDSAADDEFRDLSFEFGVELDDITTEREMFAREAGGAGSELASKSDEIVYKIDVPANRCVRSRSWTRYCDIYICLCMHLDHGATLRQTSLLVPSGDFVAISNTARYDLLCLEGISRSLRVFLGMEPVRDFTVVKPADDARVTMFVEPETALIRPHIVCAVLRGVTFTPDSYNSFLDLQDHLHKNICRKRSLVAIGTHDLSTIKAPFTYKALAPSSIEFRPLMEERTFTADKLMHYYEHEKVNSKLKPYVKLISSSPVFPVIYDANDTVLSLPPIINGEHSKISLATRDVFIECTATDLTKAHVVLNMMVTMFSPYCTDAFTVEAVDIVYRQAPPAAFGRGSDGAVGACHQTTPDLACRAIRASMKYMNGGIGINIEAARAAQLLTRMSMRAEVDAATDEVVVAVPPTRPDVLHACDVMEDLAICYGFGNLVPTVPPTPTEGRQQPLNKLSDLMRETLAQAGYTEALTWALCSHDENYAFLRKGDDHQAVKVSNPQTLEFQLVRSNLIGGLLKTLAHNQGHLQLPIRIFEVSDVAFLDESTDVGARNQRRVSALHCGATSGLEEIHGVLDRLMQLNGVRFAHEEKALREKDLQGKRKDANAAVYDIRPSTDETFFEGRRVDIFLNGAKIGVCGVVHPETLQHFAIPCPCAALELDLEAVLALHLAPRA